MEWKQCNGKIKLPKYMINEGVSDECHTYASKLCPKCKKQYCHNHIKKHNCE